MAPRLCEEQQILFSNNMKYSDFVAGKYFFAKLVLRHFRGALNQSRTPFMLKLWGDHGSIRINVKLKKQTRVNTWKICSNVNCDQHNNVQVPVVQKVDSAIHWINHHPVDNAISFRYPTFEQPEPGQASKNKNHKLNTVAVCGLVFLRLICFFLATQ